MGHRLRIGFYGAVLAAGLAGRLAHGAVAAAESQFPPRLRRPVALIVSADGSLLFVANRDSGSVSVIDTAGLRVVDEVDVGRRLSDLTATPDGNYLLATDGEANELVVLSRDRERLKPKCRVRIDGTPVTAVIDGRGARCFVASLWSRQLTAIDLASLLGPAEGAVDGPAAIAAELTGTRSIALPFAPREQVLVRGGNKLIVAGAFGGRLGVVDPARAALEAVRVMPGHNVRGLAPSHDGLRLLVSHQILNSLAETTQNDVFWGVVMTNNLRWLALDAVLSPEAEMLEGSNVHFLGDPGDATGDPAGVAVTEDGRVVVALAGVNQVATGTGAAASFRRLDVGRRPTALVLSPDDRRAYVANTFSDSVSVVDLESNKVETEISLGPQREPTLAERGEMLFSDARLSLDGWYSCYSCHTDGHSNGQLNDNLGDGTFGAPKRVLSLLGTAETGPWAWNGRIDTLEQQIRKSIRTTMQGPEPTANQVESLAAYLRSLPPAPPLGPPRDDEDEVARGAALFEEQGCAECHRPPTYTSKGTYDVALADRLGNSRFNPPSLRGIGQRGGYFHDNRAGRLEEVFTEYQHGLGVELSQREIDDLLHFLRSL